MDGRAKERIEAGRDESLSATETTKASSLFPTKGRADGRMDSELSTYGFLCASFNVHPIRAKGSSRSQFHQTRRNNAFKYPKKVVQRKVRRQRTKKKRFKTTDDRSQGRGKCGQKAVNRVSQIWVLGIAIFSPALSPRILPRLTRGEGE